MAEQSGGMTPSKGQKSAMSNMDQTGKPLGWLADFVRQIALQGQTKTPGQQPMANLGVPMPQMGMPGGMPMMPNIPGFGVPVQPMNGMQMGMPQGAPQTPQAPGPPKTPGGGGDIGGGATHDGEGVLSGLLKIISMFGGHGG